MTTETTVMAILERANPVPPGELVDVPVGATRYLETALEQRSEPMTIVDPTPTRTGEPPRRRWPLIAVAASIVAILVASIALIVATRDDATVVDTPATVPPTVPATAPEAVEPAPTTVPVPDTAAAQAVVDELFSAYNAGDTDAVLALMSDDVIVTEAYGGSPSPASYDPDEDYSVELSLAWSHAQGEVWTEPTCEVADEQRPAGATLRCSWGTMQAVEQAVGGVVATNSIIVVSEGEVVELHFGYGQPDFAFLGSAFRRWLEQHHPDVEGADCCSGDTRQESEQRGRLRAQWAQEWAGWLDTYGCSPTGLCTMPLADWVAEYEGQCLADESLDASAALRDHMRPFPRPSPLSFAGDLLLETDAALLATGLTDDRRAELLQQRLDAMIELGIDPACHPTVG